MCVPRNTVLRLLLAAAAMGGFAACENDTDGPGRPGYQLAGPVQNQVALVTVTSSRSQMQGDNATSATITVTALNPATGASVPNLTLALMTTNIGHFGSSDGPTELAIEFFGGSARTVFFSGTVEGTATIRAEVNGGVGITSIRVTCPDEGCTVEEPPPPIF